MSKYLYHLKTYSKSSHLCKSKVCDDNMSLSVNQQVLWLQVSGGERKIALTSLCTTINFPVNSSVSSIFYLHFWLLDPQPTLTFKLTRITCTQLRGSEDTREQKQSLQSRTKLSKAKT